MPPHGKIFVDLSGLLLSLALTRLVSPVVTSVWSPYLDVQVNESVLLNCSSTGMPPPSYWWMKNGEILHEVNWPEFVIPSVQAADGGLYECLAHNKWGNTTVQTVLRGWCYFY